MYNAALNHRLVQARQAELRCSAAASFNRADTRQETIRADRVWFSRARAILQPSMLRRFVVRAGA